MLTAYRKHLRASGKSDTFLSCVVNLPSSINIPLCYLKRADHIRMLGSLPLSILGSAGFFVVRISPRSWHERHLMNAWHHTDVTRCMLYDFFWERPFSKHSGSVSDSSRTSGLGGLGKWGRLLTDKMSPRPSAIPPNRTPPPPPWVFISLHFWYIFQFLKVKIFLPTWPAQNPIQFTGFCLDKNNECSETVPGKKKGNKM